MENSIKAFRFWSENEDGRETQEMSNKRVKIAVILILCFLLLNFVLVFVVMNRTSKLSLPSSSRDFETAVNQTQQTGKIVGQLKFELRGIENFRNSTEEKFESHQIQIEALSNRTKIDKEIETLENENGELKKSHEKLIQRFKLLSRKFNHLENPQPLQSCSDALEFLPSSRSKKQTIYPYGNGTSLEVLCDFEVDGGGWTIIQKRSSGPREEFYRTWTEYQNGFGSLDGNFWLGLENIHALTKNGDQELRIQLEDFQGEKRYAKYSTFSISEASDFYRLSIGGYYGDSTAGDSMTGAWNINGSLFSTKDADNDGWQQSCAQWRHGAWWYRNLNGACAHSNLNGWYRQPAESFEYGNGIVWESWTGATTPLKKVQMAIRKRD